MTITSAHAEPFIQGQNSVTYTLTVSNAGPASTNGSTVTVADVLPSGLFPTAVAGNGWTCIQPAGPCTRSDALSAGSSYPAITLTANVTGNGQTTVANQAVVSGGGSAPAGTSDPTTIHYYSNPLAFAVPASVVAEVPTTFSVTYASMAGAADIASGTVLIDSYAGMWCPLE